MSGLPRPIFVVRVFRVFRAFRGQDLVFMHSPMGSGKAKNGMPTDDVRMSPEIIELIILGSRLVIVIYKNSIRSAAINLIFSISSHLLHTSDRVGKYVS